MNPFFAQQVLATVAQNSSDAFIVKKLACVSKHIRQQVDMSSKPCLKFNQNKLIGEVIAMVNEYIVALGHMKMIKCESKCLYKKLFIHINKYRADLFALCDNNQRTCDYNTHLKVYEKLKCKLYRDCIKRNEGFIFPIRDGTLSLIDCHIEYNSGFDLYPHYDLLETLILKYHIQGKTIPSISQNAQANHEFMSEQKKLGKILKHERDIRKKLEQIGE